ncbi:sialidase family protein [Arenibacter latericius]|uniref:sialidase family protein n=1 Tax=Arenibacter latericius TaxID=86104 RepID=UPI0004108FD7|nr:sialidase family protein [Arenibacter latericius]
MTKCSFLKSIGIPIIVILFLASCGSQLDKIQEPTVVGTPPYNAFIGLTRLDNGEIRHYNYGEGNKEGKSFYIRSQDNGFTWDTVQVENKWIGADVKSPLTGEYVRLETGENGVLALRSNGGIDGDWTKTQVYEAKEEEGSYIMLKPPVFIRQGKRILVGAHSTARFGCGVFYSDDDGLSWKRSQFVQSPPHQAGGVHKGQRWNHGAVEPTVIELNDGRIWMLARTAQDQHYESFSEDGGETWSPLKPSSFYGTITMPTMKRLKDGQLLFIWNNTTPLPEKEGVNGVWEDVFTNRDVLHAAISEDDGKTWTGFRELFLNPNRNDPNFGVADQSLSLDMSVHQNQSVELPGGKALVSLGQHRDHRKMLIFDPEWLKETTREDDFTNGLDNWTTFLYQKGIIGHCAYNREEGALLVEDPTETSKQVLKIVRKDSEDLEIANQGAVWNFPALQKGRFSTSVYIPEGSQGGRISLSDRWFNASDTTAYKFAMYNYPLDGLQENKWHILYFKYDLGNENKNCVVTDENGKEIASLPLNRESIHGLSYVHFISTAKQEDKQGFLVGPVRSGPK